jgi:hypothetical protein
MRHALKLAICAIIYFHLKRLQYQETGDNWIKCRKFGPKRKEMGGWGKLGNKGFITCTINQILIG